MRFEERLNEGTTLLSGKIISEKMKIYDKNSLCFDVSTDIGNVIVIIANVVPLQGQLSIKNMSVAVYGTFASGKIFADRVEYFRR